MGSGEDSRDLTMIGNYKEHAAIWDWDGFDLNHLLKIKDIKNAFECIKKHVRKGGCFVII